MTDSLRSSVTHYIDHLEDVPWIDSLVARHGLDAVLQECITVLAGQNPDEVHEVTTFLRDLGIAGIVSDDLSTRVRELMPASVLPALRPLLRSPVLDVRMAAIYTIGKLSFPSEAAAFREVLPAYLERGDPLCLARLLSELAWLRDDAGVEAALERVIAHPSYLIHWSALDHLARLGTRSGPSLDSKLRRLRTLSTDPAPLVAAEARYQLAELELDLAAAAAGRQPAAEWQQQRQALKQTEPSLTFSTLELRFLNELHRTGQADYTLEQLAAFVDALKPSLEP